MSTIAHIDPSHDTSRYTVGWIAPLPLELTAAVGMLEDPTTMEVPDDDVLYHVGRIGSHFVVMVVCPRMGIEPAATALANMRRSFPNIKHVLVVGIAGGVQVDNVALSPPSTGTTSPPPTSSLAFASQASRVAEVLVKKSCISESME
ncbi:hypothetical protein B0H65DRAFT_304167 [Neurospora tetraspora]|uniref:Nucleoside phosphorylase domain-containing protein n=1 Tax=Neurospora tetraspora TaxID=94610 RepID=A0AAE0JAC2_9PEZI|nr:hypothetical protein B0H65DRAFT_304167 [Neurospora tetraspora]